MTLRGVAREAGLSLSSVRHQHPTKTDLLRHTVWACVDTFTRSSGATEYAASRMEPREGALRRLLSQLPVTDQLWDV